MSAEQLELNGQRLDWNQMMLDVLEVPGGLGNTYNRFYEYSFANQFLLYLQGAREPVATYDRWKAMGRQVQKGEKALSILRPLMGKKQDEDGIERTFVRGFKMVRCLFTASQTTGEPLPDYEPREWSKERAIGALALTEVPFTQLNGNIAGYSYERNIAINPVAPYPFKTWLHEAGHIVLGHTEPEQMKEYLTHRGVKEFQAEATAYLCANELEATDAMDMAESRAYVQNWLKGERPDDKAIKQVFSATTAILKAGRVTVEAEVAA